MTWQTKFIPGYGPDHEPILSILCKRTYRLTHGQICQADEKEQLPFIETDEYYDGGGPMTQAIKHESDLIAFKPLTDIVLHAKAHAPRGKKAYYLDAVVQVGAFSKMIRVFGDRQVYIKGTGFGFTEPEPFKNIRLDYSRAYGGVDKLSFPETPLPYLRNPVGKGFIIKDKKTNLQHLPLPNLENPQHLLTPANLVAQKYERWPGQPLPMSFGYVSKSAHPRFLLCGFNKADYINAQAAYQGQLETMEEVGASGGQPPPSPPQLIHPEYFNGASPGLKLPYLAGNEKILLRYMDPDRPKFEFQLSGDKPRPWLDLGSGRAYLEPQLQTLEIFKETNQCTLLWRGSTHYAGPESLGKLEKLAFGEGEEE
jgi:hypothetical protein